MIGLCFVSPLSYIWLFNTDCIECLGYTLHLLDNGLTLDIHISESCIVVKSDDIDQLVEHAANKEWTNTKTFS